MRINATVFLIALCLMCSSAFCDPIGYTETFDSTNMNWRTDEATNPNLFNATEAVNYDSGSPWVYARYPQTVMFTYTSVIYADASSASPAGTLGGNVSYSGVPGLSVSLRTSSDLVLPGVSFFVASNNNTGDSSLTTSSSIFQYYLQATGLGTSWTQYTCTDFASDSWTPLRNQTLNMTFSQALADVDAIGVIYFDAGQTAETLYVDNFAVAPEPATLLMMGPAAGFLGWKLNRRRKRQPARSR